MSDRPKIRCDIHGETDDVLHVGDNKYICGQCVAELEEHRIFKEFDHPAPDLIEGWRDHKLRPEVHLMHPQMYHDIFGKWPTAEMYNAPDAKVYDPIEKRIFFGGNYLVEAMQCVSTFRKILEKK